MTISQARSNSQARSKPKGPKPASAAGPDEVKQTKGERTRARLVGAAEEVFGEGTYDEASISEITRRSGVSQGTFYIYFPAKADIFREVVRDLGHQLRSRLARSVRGANSRREVERRGFEAFFGFVQEHPSLYRIIRQAEFVDRQAFLEHYERLAEGYKEGLGAAMRSGEFRKTDPEVLAYCLMGMTELIGARWILWDGVARIPSKVVDAVLDFALNGALDKS